MNAPAADRRIRSVEELRKLRYDQDGLVPVVTQHATTSEVLMVAWADFNALRLTLKTGEMHFWSRSRGELWRKGSTSGNILTLVALHADCDGDTLLARVLPAGPVCHTDDPTCFGEVDDPPGSVLAELWSIVEDRDRERPEGSYTTRLLSDENLRLKKLGEETAELVAGIARGGENVAEEAADLVFHLVVALRGAGWSWEDVEGELRKRRG
jgi:phosphoribosyl-AMP cyclohydrolase / phosphoribosyl-ATP pyrophosphohydrolase